MGSSCSSGKQNVQRNQNTNNAQRGNVVNNNGRQRLGLQSQQQQLVQRPVQQQQIQQNGNQPVGNQNKSQIPAPNYPVMPVSKVSVLYNKSMVRQQTLKINKNNQLTFIYDAQAPCRFTIYFFIEETLSFFHETVQEIWPHKEYNLEQNPEIFMCQQEYELKTNLQYTTKTQINYADRPQLAYKHKSDGLKHYWPLVIKIEQFNPVQVMYYYCEIEQHGDERIVKFVKQRLEKDNGAYIVQEIYGIDNTELINGQPVESHQMQQLANEENTNKECIICFTDLIDTVILPCRHMCICMECAKSIQSQKSKQKKNCPICRKQIESFLRIQKHSKQQQHQMQQEQN